MYFSFHFHCFQLLNSNCRYFIYVLELQIFYLCSRTADILFMLSNCRYWISNLELQILNFETRTADIESRMMPSGFSGISFYLICQTSILITQSTKSKFSHVWWNMCVHFLVVTQWLNPLNLFFCPCFQNSESFMNELSHSSFPQRIFKGTNVPFLGLDICTYGSHHDFRNI